MAYRDRDRRPRGARRSPEDCRSGRTSRPAAKTASARNARSTTNASSRACGSAPPNRTGDRESSPAVRRCGGPPKRVRRSHPDLPVRGHRRGAPARRRGDAELRHRASATTASTISSGYRPCAGSNLMTDRERADSAEGRDGARPRQCAGVFLRAPDDPLRGAGGTGNETRIRVGSSQLKLADEGAVAGPRDRGPRSGSRAGPRPAPDVCLGARAAELRKDSSSSSAPTTRVRLLPRSRGRGVFLRASPIDVSDIVASCSSIG